MVVEVSAVVLLGAIVLIFIKKCGLKTAHVIVCVLFGFFLASTTWAPDINRVLAGVAEMISQINF
ncbi:hypothetical protein [Streptomyces bottropensis]|uniref:hypothetical protein n=1 Tax=Streptomyces bottropensis TaxID=42235 RepID=UPI0036CFA6C3